MGTTLRQRAGDPALFPDDTVESNPSAIAKVHSDFRSAGAEWLKTHTFGALFNPRRLSQGRSARHASALLCVELARAAADGAFVLGTLGPVGPEAPELWSSRYGELVEDLLEAGVDGWIIETATRIAAAEAAVREAARSGLVVIASFSPDAEGRALDGTSADEALNRFRDAGADVVGVNCGANSGACLRSLEGDNCPRDVPLFAAPAASFPAAGSTNGAQAPHPPDVFIEEAIQLRDVGVRALAGCCGASPDHIAALRRRLSF